MSSYAMIHATATNGELLDRVTIKQVRARFPALPEVEDLSELEALFEEAEVSMVEQLGLFPVAGPLEKRPTPAEGETVEESAPIQREDGSWGRDWIIHRELEVFAADKLYARLNGEQRTFPYTFEQFRADRPGIATRPPPFLQVDDEWGIVEVDAVEPPAVTAGQLVEAAGIEHVGGRWRQAWSVRNRSADELAAAKASLLAALADRRWRAEEAGTMLGDWPIATDRVSQNKLTGANLRVERDPDYAIPNWKLAPGVYVPLDGAAIVAAGDAVFAHVQACFDREAELSAEIAGADWAGLAAIDIGAGWPGQETP